MPDSRIIIYHDLRLSSPWTTLCEIWQEFTFDWRHGVRTSRVIPVELLGYTEPQVQSMAHRHRPAHVYRVSKSFEALGRHGCVFADSTFVDYGCGAGRVLILAAEARFGNVWGVELSHRLLALCRRNVEGYQRRHPEVDIHIVECDAAHWSPPMEANVFFCFDPFNSYVYERVVERIKASLRERPRRIFLLNMWADFPFEAAGFRRLETVETIDLYDIVDHESSSM